MSTHAVDGVYLAALEILLVAGGLKALRPVETAIALRSAGLPVTPTRVRLGAAAEVVLAVVALSVPGPVPAAVVAGSYAGFAAFVALALVRRWPLASCGCFGKADTAPTVGHVAVDVAAALAASWWAVAAGVTGEPGLWRVVANQAGHGLPLVMSSLALALVASLVLTNPLSQADRR